MTSPSRRKRPITRRSIRTWTATSRSLGFAVSCAAVIGAAGVARCGEPQPLADNSGATFEEPIQQEGHQKPVAEHWHSLIAKPQRQAAPPAAPAQVESAAWSGRGKAEPGAAPAKAQVKPVAAAAVADPGPSLEGAARPAEPGAAPAKAQVKPVAAAAVADPGPSLEGAARPAEPKQNVDETPDYTDLPSAYEPRWTMRTAQVPGEPGAGTRYKEPARSPDELKRVTDIAPFYDYEPDPLIRADDPCQNICPRPDGRPCKLYPNGSAPACPEEVGLGQREYRERELAPGVFAWTASNLYHNPLYFEDFDLERYGHTYPCCVQPFVSTGKFSLQLLGLPYQMAIDPMCKCQYTLGWYRPGECAPKLHYQIPWNTHAAAVQAGVMTGLFYAIP